MVGGTSSGETNSITPQSRANFCPGEQTVLVKPTAMTDGDHPQQSSSQMSSSRTRKSSSEAEASILPSETITGHQSASKQSSSASEVVTQPRVPSEVSKLNAAKSTSSFSSSSSHSGSGGRGQGTGHNPSVVISEAGALTLTCSSRNNDQKLNNATNGSSQVITQASSNSSTFGFGKKSKKNKKDSKRRETSSSGSSLNVSTASLAQQQQSQLQQVLNHSGQSDQSSNQDKSTTAVTSRKYSRSHQRRFHRRFPAVDPDEMLIDWFNCALIADILLQGYLYISDNYFAFYSNIFGYKTQLLIPISDVVAVSKEKTAKIFPNAVGICTEEAKYLFGSLISRESTYKLLHEVWQTFEYHVKSIPLFDPRSDSLHDSLFEHVSFKVDQSRSNKHLRVTSGMSKKSQDTEQDCCDQSMNQSATDSIAGSAGGVRTSVSESTSSDESNSQVDLDSTASAAGLFALNDQATLLPSRRKRIQTFVTSRIKSGMDKLSNPKSWNGLNLMVIATVALVLLFFSTALLMYRVRQVYSRLEDISLVAGSSSLFGDGETFDGGHFAQEVKRVSSKLQVKLREVSELRETLEGLLHAVVQLP